MTLVTENNLKKDIQIALNTLRVSTLNFPAHNGLAPIEALQPANGFEIHSPVDGQRIASVQHASESDYEQLTKQAIQAFNYWRNVPAPKRGEIVRQLGDAFRKYKTELGYLVSYEMGKPLQEGLGEVQEIIDICDFAVGLSRQLYGLTMPSERPHHRLAEQWHPLGVVGIISAFNFPVAVWAWNSMIAAVCGNVSIWKPSEKTPNCAVACMHIVSEVFRANNVPAGVMSMVIGDAKLGELMANDHRLPLISATGSTRMGKSVAQNVARRLGRCLLELGGNNAIILSEHADLKTALVPILFSAVGTAGQRCTTARRLIIHQSIYDQVKQTLINAYQQLSEKVGNPLDEKNLIGPLIDKQAVNTMQEVLAAVQKEGGKLLAGGTVLNHLGTGNYVTPALVEAQNDYASVQQETFAPILYIMPYNTLDQAITLQNAVPQGLSSSIFTLNMREMEQFLSVNGSDCGIANVNIGPSGAEIGGAFGGEKETGGGRESGSDAWKAYMRRQTVTVNYGTELTLAQGIKFEL